MSGQGNSLNSQQLKQKYTEEKIIDEIADTIMIDYDAGFVDKSVGINVTAKGIKTDRQALIQGFFKNLFSFENITFGSNKNGYINIS